MKNTKIISVLKTFTPAEIKKFRDFVKSPYYNKNKNVIKLNEVLIKFYPEFDSEKLTEERIFKDVFAGEKFDYFKIKNITSDLYNLSLEFLKTVSNPFTHFKEDYNLMVQFRMRKLFKLHKKMVNSVSADFAEVNVKDKVLLYDSYLLSMESQFVDLFEKPSSISGILTEFENFYEYLIFSLLEYYNLMIHIGKENKVVIDIKMIDEIMSFLEKGPVSKHPTTLSYQYLILLKMKQAEEYYFILKEHYLKHFAELDAAAAYRTNMYMFGYCADMFNFKGDRRFIQEGYELFVHSYKNNYVISGELLYPDFVNFIKVFMRAGDGEIARKFIADYKDMLPADQYDNSINFSNAYISHYEGELEKALMFIRKVNFPLAILKVQVKIMEIQLNYQLEYYEETRELMESFKKTLQREAVVSDDYKNSILDFLKYTTALINIKQETSADELDYMINTLVENVAAKQGNHFGVKFWLEDRINEPGFKYKKAK